MIEGDVEVGVTYKHKNGDLYQVDMFPQGQIHNKWIDGVLYFPEADPSKFYWRPLQSFKENFYPFYDETSG